MDFADIRKNLEEYFEDLWINDEDEPLTPIAYENVPFENDADSWVRFSLKFADSKNMVIGGSRVGTPGFISVQVFTKADTGSGDAYALADTVKSILENKTIGNIFTYATSVEIIGDGIRKINKIEYGEFQLLVKTRFEAT